MNEELEKLINGVINWLTQNGSLFATTSAISKFIHDGSSKNIRYLYYENAHDDVADRISFSLEPESRNVSRENLGDQEMLKDFFYKAKLDQKKIDSILHLLTLDPLPNKPVFTSILDSDDGKRVVIFISYDSLVSAYNNNKPSNISLITFDMFQTDEDNELIKMSVNFISAWRGTENDVQKR